MEFVASLDSMDEVMKQCGLEVSFLNDFLGGGNTREVVATSAAMEIVQDSIYFVNGQTSEEYGVDPISV